MATQRYNIPTMGEGSTGKEDVIYTPAVQQIDGLLGGTIKVDVSAGGTLDLDTISPTALDNFANIEFTGTPAGGVDIVCRDEEWKKWFGNFCGQTITITTTSGPAFKPTIAAGNGCEVSNTNQGGAPAAELRRDTPETPHSS